MSELIPDQRSEDMPRIPRVSPEVTIPLGEHTVQLTYHNATIYTFPDPYARMNHVYVKHPEIDGFEASYLFDCEVLSEQLRGLNFPEQRYPWPSEGDLDNYEAYESQKIEAELVKLLNPDGE